MPLAMFRLWFERKKDRKARTPFYFYMLLHVEVWNEHIKVLYLASCTNGIVFATVMEGVTDKSPGRSWVFGSLHSHQRSSRACSTFPLSIYCIFLFFSKLYFSCIPKMNFPDIVICISLTLGFGSRHSHHGVIPLFPPSPPYKQCIITMYNVSAIHPPVVSACTAQPICPMSITRCST